MATDEKDILTVLREELAFLEQGGYRETGRAAWRPQFIFQDSPTCLNFDPTKPLRPCSECPLMQFVPEQERTKRVPCRYIPLDKSGETIDSLYRCGTQEETEEALREWLKATIMRLEREKAEQPKTMFSVCANPDCQFPFKCQEGRLFRFHKEHAPGEPPANTHSVQHFWLCAQCCREHTLEYRDGRGVLIRQNPEVVTEPGTSRWIAAA